MSAFSSIDDNWDIFPKHTSEKEKEFLFTNRPPEDPQDDWNWNQVSSSSTDFETLKQIKIVSFIDPQSMEEKFKNNLSSIYLTPNSSSDSLESSRSPVLHGELSTTMKVIWNNENENYELVRDIENGPVNEKKYSSIYETKSSASVSNFLTFHKDMASSTYFYPPPVQSSIQISYTTSKKNFIGSGRYADVYRGSFRLPYHPHISSTNSNSDTDASLYKFDCVIKCLHDGDPESLTAALIESKYLSRCASCPYIIGYYGLYHERSNDKCKSETNLASTLSTIPNENITSPIPTMLKSKKCFMMLEYCSNGSMYDFIRKKTHLLSPLLICRWGVQLATALQTLKDEKIIHHDIKPFNIFVTQSLDLRLGDFNSARADDQIGGILQDGLGHGTQAYSAPEVILQQSYDSSIDVYSFGVTLFVLLTGLDPFYGIRNPVHLLLNIKKGFFLSGANDWYGNDNYAPQCRPLLFDKDIKSKIELCTDKNPSKRPTPSQLLSFFHDKVKQYSNVS